MQKHKLSIFANLFAGYSINFIYFIPKTRLHLVSIKLLTRDFEINDISRIANQD